MANNAVAIKLPTFWTEQPDIWFTPAESQFQIRNISADETNYYHVVAALDQIAAKHIITILSNPPEENKHGTLNDILINTYGLCEAERASQLLHLPGLGDSKPSEYMDNILALLGNHTPCFLFRQLFIEQMLANMRPHLARINDDNYILAQEADKLWHSNPSPICDASPITTSQCHIKQLSIGDYHHHRQIIYHQQPVVSVTTIVRFGT